MMRELRLSPVSFLKAQCLYRPTGEGGTVAYEMSNRMFSYYAGPGSGTEYYGYAADNIANRRV